MGRGGTGVVARAGSIQIDFTYQGIRHRVTFRVGDIIMPPTPANLLLAKRTVVEIRQKIKLGVFVMADYFPEEAQIGSGTVADMLDGFIRSLRAPASTKAKYSSAAKFWSAEIGTRPARLIKPSEIRTAIAAHPQKSGKTLNDYLSVLRQAFNAWMDDGVIESNPTAKIDALPHQKEPPDPFDHREMEIIIAELAHQDPAHGDHAEFRFFTGMRTGELLGLQWSSVDFRRKQVMVREAFVRGEQKDSVKTGRVRFVDLNSRALAAIKRQKARTFLAGANVFVNPRTGSPYRSETEFSRLVWAPALKRVGVRYRRPYNSRHTYATMMLMAGLTPAYCAAQLGHSIEMFLTIYARWINGDRNAMEQAQLERFLGSASGAISGAI